MAEAPTRKLAAILAADVVGYSRLMRADETGTLAAMKALWSEVVQPSVRAHRGRVFKLMGDGMLAEFGSVVDAANAAEAIQTAANERASDKPEDNAIRLRIGINLGDVVVDGSDLYGDGVNIAARLQEVAESGGIAVSDHTHAHLAGRSSLSLTDSGARNLKNISEAVRVWVWPEPQAGSAGLKEHSAAQASQTVGPSIAVLPVRDLSPEASDEYFADGLLEDIINALSKFGWLDVIARSTMATYKGKDIPLPQVGADLNVSFLLETSLRRAGQRLRVSTQLIDAASGNQIWSERFDRELDDIFAIQDEITAAIAARIAPEIQQAESRRADHARPSEIDAWLLYQQGLSASSFISRASLHRAISLFERVISIDPNFAPAYSAAAHSLASLAQTFDADDYESLMDRASIHIDKALEIDGRDPIVLASASRVHSSLGKHEQAINFARLSLQLNPNLLTAYQALGLACTQTGRFDEGLAAYDQAIRLSPLDPNINRALMMRSAIHFLQERYPECIADAEQANSLGNRAHWTYVMLPIAYHRMGMENLVSQSMRELRRIHPDFSIAALKSSGRHIYPDIMEKYATALRELGVPEA